MMTPWLMNQRECDDIHRNICRKNEIDRETDKEWELKRLSKHLFTSLRIPLDVYRLQIYTWLSISKYQQHYEDVYLVLCKM